MLFDNDTLPKHFKNVYTEYMHLVEDCKMHLNIDSATGRMIYDLNLEPIFSYYTGDLHFAPASAYDNYKMLADLSAGNKILVTTYQEIAKEYNSLKVASNRERWEFGERFDSYDKVIICTDFIITDERVSPFGEFSCHELIIESVHIDKRVTKLIDWFAYCKVDTIILRNIDFSNVTAMHNFMSLVIHSSQGAHNVDIDMTGTNHINIFDYCFAGYNIQQITFRNFRPERFYFTSISQYRTNCCYFLQKNSKPLHIVVGNETGYKFLHNIIESSHNFDDAVLTLDNSVDTPEV